MMNCSNSMKKQKGFDEEENYKDKLSELPDELIINILSFLPIRDAVKTVLIRRFGNLRTLIPTLRFVGSDTQKFVFNVMNFHKSSTIDKFELLNVPSFSQENLINFTNIALTKNPKFLSVQNYYYDFWVPKAYHLPSNTLRNRSIVSLYLYRLEIKFMGEVDMSSLRKLELVQVSMNYDTFRVLTSGCCRLQELVIKYPHNLTKIHFTAPNIEKLEFQLEHFTTLEEQLSYSLDCPNLKILHVKGICLGTLRLINVSSVQVAKINRCYEWPGCDRFDTTLDEYNMIQDEFNKLSNKLRHVEFLEWDDGAGAYMDLFCDCNMLMDELSSPCVLHNLRHFIIKEYKKPCEALSQLIAFVLNSAVFLEEVDIRISGKDELFSAKGLEFILQLLSFPRASPKAKVKFHVH